MSEKQRVEFREEPITFNFYQSGRKTESEQDESQSITFSSYNLQVNSDVSSVDANVTTESEVEGEFQDYDEDAQDMFDIATLQIQKMDTFEKSVKVVDKAVKAMKTVLGLITDRMGYFDQIRCKDDVFYVDVNADSKARAFFTIGRPMKNKAVQVTPKEIEEEFVSRGMVMWTGHDDFRRQLYSKPPPTDPDLPTKRVDAAVQTRPVGYIPLSLKEPMQTLKEAAETRVTGTMMDVDYAKDRGIYVDDNDILWPTIEEFTVELALSKIEEYIKLHWVLDPKWMYHLKYLQNIQTDHKKQYVIEVIFSCPTAQHPVPAATASVFFVFQISHVAPKFETVEVHYVIEGTRYRHTPGSVPFHDKWLWAIISDKTKIHREFNF